MKKLVVFVLLLGVWKCSIAQSTYFPLEKGSTFSYSYGKDLYEGRNINVDEMKMTVQVLNNNKVINGKEYFVVETSAGGKSPTVFTTYVRVAEDGTVYTIYEEGSSEYMSLTASPKIGDTFTSENGGYTKTAKVIALDGKITTPTDTYSDCLVMESTDGVTVTRSYSVKNRGMVATTVIMEGEEKVFVYLVND